jgi:hypothetical protein
VRNYKGGKKKTPGWRYELNPFPTLSFLIICMFKFEMQKITKKKKKLWYVEVLSSVFLYEYILTCCFVRVQNLVADTEGETYAEGV